MSKLKVFTLGNHGFIDTPTGDALNLPSHTRQARVLVAATSKAHAVQVLAERGFPHHPPRDPEFRTAMGNELNALIDAGLLAEPAVLVMPLLGHPGDGVVAMQPGGTPRRIGRLEGGWGEPTVFVADDFQRASEGS
ncbi:hypothetical protein BDK92_7196 [Micromonospora pisi]|uniref:Uncharacterized protein n=2 Tax=Micromonospora pisi TaxID=589240 RepID=A0A495JVW0_9ACTN|nr:hypothetical protein BDK92_7196 [Micromonospora pisi]